MPVEFQLTFLIHFLWIENVTSDEKSVEGKIAGRVIWTICEIPSRRNTFQMTSHLMDLWLQCLKPGGVNEYMPQPWPSSPSLQPRCYGGENTGGDYLLRVVDMLPKLWESSSSPSRLPVIMGREKEDNPFFQSHSPHTSLAVKKERRKAQVLPGL